MKRKLREQYTYGAYNKCITCKYLGNGCDGPRTSSMPTERWCAFMYQIKEHKNLTNEEIAEGSGISLPTVNKIMSSNAPSDLRRSTITALEDFLIGTSGTYPCPYEVLTNDEAATIRRELEIRNTQVAELNRTIENIHASYQKELDAIREEAQRKIDYLLNEDRRKASVIDRLLGR